MLSTTLRIKAGSHALVHRNGNESCVLYRNRTGYELGTGAHGRPRYRDWNFQYFNVAQILLNMPNLELPILFLLDFSEPFFPPGSAKPPGGGGGATASEESIAIISSLGFTRDQAIKALKATVSNEEIALQLLLLLLG